MNKPNIWKHPMERGQVVPQVGINPDVLASDPVQCVGGPCDGQMMRCPDGRVLILTNAVDGLRACSLPESHIALAKKVGGYDGHYDRRGDELLWHENSELVGGAPNAGADNG